MKYKKLRLRILEKFDTYENFAAALGRSAGYVTRYMQGHSTFNQTIILEWCELLGISHNEIPTYFFALEVSETKPDEA